jgi:hypothetical protein
MPPTTFDAPRAVDYLGTSTLLARAATFDRLGGFDERYYPVYYVDVDLAMAVRASGEVVLYEPRAVSRHQRGASAGGMDYRWWLTQRHRAAFLAKWGDRVHQQEARGRGGRRAIARALRRAEDEAREAAATVGASRVAPPALPRPERPLDADAYAACERALRQEFAASGVTAPVERRGTGVVVLLRRLARRAGGWLRLGRRQQARPAGDSR